jgi:hypothetical protein
MAITDAMTTPVPPLRQRYIDEIAKLKDLAAGMRAAGSTPEEIALRLHTKRRVIALRYKYLTAPEARGSIYQRNLRKYGDQLGPTIEYLRNTGKSWEAIIESASRAGGKDLGL